MQAIESNRNSLVLIGLIFLALMWAVTSTDFKEDLNVNQIKPVAALALMEAGKILVLDVREKEAYDKGHLPNAILVPIGDLDKRINEFEAHKAEEVVVYCNDGRKRGPRATKKLNEAGYVGAKNLEGGVEGWKAASYLLIK